MQREDRGLAWTGGKTGDICSPNSKKASILLLFFSLFSLFSVSVSFFFQPVVAIAFSQNHS